MLHRLDGSSTSKKNAVPYVTYRYKTEPLVSQYAALRSARWHAKEYRNACLEERIGPYRAAKAAALRAGRDKVTPGDWLTARGPHAPAFLAWQDIGPPLRKRRGRNVETT